MHALGFQHENIFEGIYAGYFKVDQHNQKNYLLPSIGPHNNDSIMNFPSCVNQLPDVNNGARGYPELSTFKLSESDINKINYFYGTNLCTYDGFKSFFNSSASGAKYYQPFFICKSCLGMKSELKICIFCAEIHHYKHEKVYVKFQDVINETSAVDFECECGKNQHSIGCTRKFSKYEKSQTAYRCKTCHILNKSIPDDEMPRICYQCCIKCHFEHDIVHGDTEKFVCGCGKKYVSPCYLR